MACCATLAGNLFLFDDTFEDNIATNGAAVYAEQGCGEVHAPGNLFTTFSAVFVVHIICTHTNLQ